MTSIEKRVNKFLIGAVLGGGVAGMGSEKLQGDSSSRNPSSSSIQTPVSHTSKSSHRGMISSVQDFLSLGVRELFKSSKKSS